MRRYSASLREMRQPAQQTLRHAPHLHRNARKYSGEISFTFSVYDSPLLKNF